MTTGFNKISNKFAACIKLSKGAMDFIVHSMICEQRK